MPDLLELQQLEVALEIVLESESLSDLCRRAVLSPSMRGSFQACHILLIDQDGKLSPEAKFGADLPADYLEFANKALFSHELTYRPETPNSPAIAALPLTSANIPAGVAVLLLNPARDPSLQPVIVSKDVVPMISKLLGIHLNSRSKDKGIQTFSGNLTVAEMSTRQVKILEFMAEGLTNAEIARRLLLSESTVRQESVKIYRALNTDNRQEAVAEGRNLGLIPKLPISS